VRRTFIADATSIGLEGQLLFTLYEDGSTIAYREKPWHTWSPPIIAKETE